MYQGEQQSLQGGSNEDDREAVQLQDCMGRKRLA
jgi:hypothetical protein